MSLVRRKAILFISFVLFGTLLTFILSTSLPSARAASLSPHTWYAQVGVQSDDMAIQGMALLPHSLWINVGDTVVWTSKAAEIHTVTFLAPGQTLPPFNPGDPQQALPQGGNVFTGAAYYNSGLLSNMKTMPVPGGDHYRLTFAVAGDFTYSCLVHPGMSGVIHVRPAGTPYPFTQRDYNRQIEENVDAIIRDGHQLMDRAEGMSNNHQVNILGDGLVTVMRFFPKQVRIHVGESITFTNRDVMEPHTVTFGPSQANPFAPYGNPNTFDGSTPLNSGYLGAHFPFGTTFTVHFIKEGTYDFRCDLHDMMGMAIRITVEA